MTLPTMPRVVRLDLASVTLPEWHPEAARARDCVVYGYAVEHPDGVILFDTGVGADSEVIDEFYQPQVVLLDSALEARGLAPESVIAVVNSHLHFDHCGQNPLFYGTAVPFFVGADEVDAVAAEQTYTIAEWADVPERQGNLLRSDLLIVPGVTVLAAPGHTSGHQALLIESDEGRVVIAGQAVWNIQEFEDEVATDSNVSDADLRPLALDTIRRIKSLRPDRVLFAHCDHWTPAG